MMFEHFVLIVKLVLPQLLIVKLCVHFVLISDL